MSAGHYYLWDQDAGTTQSGYRTDVRVGCMKIIQFNLVHLVDYYNPHLLLCRVVYSWEYGSTLICRPIVLGCEINLVINHCHSLFSIHQSGRVVSLPSTMHRTPCLCGSEQATRDHQEGARSDRVAVTHIHLYFCASYDPSPPWMKHSA